MLYVQATNQAWSDTTKHMLKDMAQVPPKIWGKYWPLMMKYLDWACDPDCQVQNINPLYCIASWSLQVMHVGNAINWIVHEYVPIHAESLLLLHEQ